MVEGKDPNTCFILFNNPYLPWLIFLTMLTLVWKLCMNVMFIISLKT